MVTDYEAAWIELQRYVAEKSQHGRDGLLQKMAGLAAEHRVAAGEKSRVLRLYSIEVEQQRQAEMQSIHQPDTDERLGAGFDSDLDGVRPAHHDHLGGHDVSRTARTAGAAVR